MPRENCLIRKLFLPSLALSILIPITVIINSYILINPVFYIFMYSLIGIIVLILIDRNKRVWVPILFTYNAIDCVFVVSGLIVLFLINFDSHSIFPEILRYCFSFILLFFLPGWLLVRILKITERLHKIPLMIISFSISFGLTSLIYTAILVLKLEPSELIVSIIYTFISLVSVLPRYLTGNSKNNKIFVKNRKKDYNLIECAGLVWIVSFFVFSILYIYPAMVENPGFDIVRHYAIASVIDEHVDLLTSPYPWFHLSLGALNDVTDIEMWLFQTAVSFTSIILIFSFYCVSKAYLYKFNKYFHLLSTIIFTCFSGLGWIFYYQNISYPMSLEEYSSLFSVSYAATYFDIGVGQGQWLWLWFRPITMDFLLTLLLLYLMRVEKLSNFSYIALTSLAIITLSLVHFPGLILFVVILLCLAIFVPRVNLHLKETAISLLISLPISGLLLLSYAMYFGSDNIRFSGQHM
ncbi:MAG TPA: hypothetical protein VD815_00290, partial [Candidatus Saccharimonadales bacterium]|nr:hypothetical protein [Candidatus Saccharimonadales bacterium]